VEGPLEKPTFCLPRMGAWFGRSTRTVSDDAVVGAVK